MPDIANRPGLAYDGEGEPIRVDDIEQDVDVIFHWIGFKATGKRDRLMEAFFPDGIRQVGNLDEKDIAAACKILGTTGQSKVVVPVLRQKKIAAVIRVVQESVLIGRKLKIALGKTPAQFNKSIEEALERMEAFSVAKSQTSDIVSRTLDKKLKNKETWELFRDHVRDICSSAVGQNKSTLSYVIREDDEPLDNVNVDETWRYLSHEALPHRGISYRTDNRVVALIIVDNIDTGSAAYGIIEQYRKSHDGRKMWKALYERFGGSDASRRLGMDAKAAYEKLKYVNEQRMSFDSFRQQFNRYVKQMEDTGIGIKPKQQRIDLIAKCLDGSLRQHAITIQSAMSIKKKGYSLEKIFTQLSVGVASSSSNGNNHWRNISSVASDGLN